MSNSGDSRRSLNLALAVMGCAVGALGSAVMFVQSLVLYVLPLTGTVFAALWVLRAHWLPSRRPDPRALRSSAVSSLRDRVLAVEWEQLRRLGDELSPPIKPPPGESDHPPSHEPASLAYWYRVMRLRRVVLIGEPRSGRTTAARRFTADLISGPLPDTGAVPVLATLTSWNPASDSVDGWFTAHLADRYGIDRSAVRSLVRRRHVLPVLDGLDEFPASQLAAVVPLLLRWLDTFPGHVLICHTSGYQELESPLRARLGFALTVGPLPSATVVAHLRQPHLPHWEPVAQAIEDDERGPLATALSAPGLLSLAVNGYASRHRNPSELTNLPDAAAIRERILTAVDPAASIRGWGPTGRERLELLADAMGREDDRLLLWWRMAERYGSPRIQGYLRAGMLVFPALGVMAVDSRLGRWFLPLMVVVALAATVGLGAERQPRRAGQPLVRLPREGSSRPYWLPSFSFGLEMGGASFVLPAVVEPRLVPSLSDTSASAVIVPLACVVAGVLFQFTGYADEPRWVRRAGDLGADLWASLARSTAVTVLFCLPLGRLVWDVNADDGAGLPWPVWAAVAAGVFGAGMSDSTWGRYRLTHLALALKRRLPFRLSRFLAAAQRQGLLVPADGYGTGCYAFHHDSVREALVARGTGRLAHVRATKRIREEIRDEVLTRPESASYLAYVSDGARETNIRESHRINALTDEVLAEELRVVADSGLNAFQNYQNARRRLVDAVPVPGWASRGLTRFYAALTVVAGIIAYETALLLIGPGSWPLTTLTVVGVTLSWLALPVSRAWAAGQGRPAGTGLESLFDITLVWITVFLFLPPFVPPNRTETVAMVSAALAIASFWAWLYAHPYVVRARAALGDDPDAWPDVPAAHLRLRDAALQARQDWVTAVAQHGVMPLIQARLRVTEDSGTAPTIPALPAIDPSRLTGSSSSDQFVSTAAADEVDFHLEALTTGSIGVSGQRGAGKSSLMQRFCTPGSASNADDLLVLVPAPTSYDSREFLIHLFAEVCRKITGDGQTDDGHPGPAPGRRTSLALHTGAALTALTGVVLLVLTLLGPELADAAHLITSHSRDLLIAGGVLLLVTGVGWELLLPVRAARSVGARSGRTEAVALASGHLRTLHYQLTVMRTRTTQLALPAGLQVADGSQVQHTRQILTHPELVARFRTLLHQVAAERRGLGGRVVIGIDELDKLDTAQEAERFLNDLKAVFGVPDCHFLVAVSEDALTAFGRHALDVRTTFDSAFDRVVTVRPLDLDQAGRLLQLRGVWLPDPYLWLCQVLSGGLPRELLRWVTTLATHRKLRNITDMRHLMSALIEDDARSVLSAQTRYATTLTGAQGPAAARWIAKASQAPVSIGEWEGAVADTPRVDAGEYETAHAVTQVRAFLSLGATLLRTFTEGSDSGIAERLTRLRDVGPDPVDRLTAARAKLAAEPEASLAAVARYRTDVLHLPPT